MKGGQKMTNKMTIDYTNKDLRPKTFFVKIERSRGGKFTVKRAKVLEQANQHARSIRRVDARDLTRAIRRNGLNVA
jgi:carbamoylphosphate synthase small subunit